MAKQLYTIVVLGPQGSGKGTQAEILAKRFKLHHIDMGALLRRFTRRQIPLAKKVKRIMVESGGLVPTDVVVKVLKHELGNLSTSRGIIFDGFPRNLKQARELDRILRSMQRHITHVFYLPISRATTIKRLTKRHREDDTPAAIAARLANYRRKTKPLISYYRSRKVLITVNGEPAISVVAKKMLTFFS